MNAHRLAHSNEREQTQEGVPSSQRQSQVKRLGLSGHHDGAEGDEGQIAQHDADDQGPVVGSEVHSDGGVEIALKRQRQERRGIHQTSRQVRHEGRHC